jgi:hypothetical protein
MLTEKRIVPACVWQIISVLLFAAQIFPNWFLLDVDVALTWLPCQAAITALSTVTSQTADKFLVVKFSVSLHVLRGPCKYKVTKSTRASLP